MNVYDFDQTLFNPDSSFLFTVTCLKKYPKLFFRILPGVAVKAIGKLMGKSGTKELKEKIFAFLPYLDNVDDEVNAFWEKNGNRIENWYLAQKHEDDLIISASPEFLLSPVCKRLGVKLISTRMDKHTGKIIGENCSNTEKVRRLYEEYPEAVIDEFYSDSLIDTPLAKLARKAFIVRYDKLSPWPDKVRRYKKSTP